MAKAAQSLDPTAARYFVEVGGCGQPTHAEEIEMFTAYRQAQTEERLGTSHTRRKQARERKVELGQKIAKGYLRFVIKQARNKTRDPELIKELISQGNIGLMIGIEKFDVTRGTRFLTYAASWIQVNMQEYLQKQGTVHVPNHTRKAMRRTRVLETKEIAKGTLHAYSSEEPVVGPIDGVAIEAPNDVEQEAIVAESNLFVFMRDAELSRCERFVLTLAFGLRGPEMSTEDIRQTLYEADGSLFTLDQLKALIQGGMRKIRELLNDRGVTSLQDIY